jgi:hypothetical protein
VLLALIAGVCCSCAATHGPAAQIERGIPVQDQQGDRRDANQITISATSERDLRAARREAAMRFGGERVLFMKIRDSNRRAIAYVSMVSRGRKDRGALTSKRGIAWLHGMEADTVRVLMFARYQGAEVRAGFVTTVHAGEITGVDVHVPRGTTGWVKKSERRSQHRSEAHATPRD